MNSEISGDFQDLILKLFAGERSEDPVDDALEEQATKLKKAGTGIFFGTNIETFIYIIT